MSLYRQSLINQPQHLTFDVTIIPISRRWIWPPVPSKNDKSGHYAAGERGLIGKNNGHVQRLLLVPCFFHLWVDLKRDLYFAFPVCLLVLGSCSLIFWQ